MRIDWPLSVRSRTDGRQRLSRGSVDRQTSHVHPIIGTPCEVPVPRNVICTRPSPLAYGTMIRGSF